MGPVDSLKQAVAEGRLQPDPGQAEIAEHLEALCDALAEWNEGKSGLFSKSRPAPRGLYLYGGVGTGKSLMMDLFFDAAPVAKKTVYSAGAYVYTSGHFSRKSIEKQ